MTVFINTNDSLWVRSLVRERRSHGPCGAAKKKPKQNTHRATLQARRLSATSGVSTPGAWAGTRKGSTTPPAPPGPGTARWRPSVGSWILHPLYLQTVRNAAGTVPTHSCTVSFPSALRLRSTNPACPSPHAPRGEGAAALSCPRRSREDRLTVPVLRDTEKRVLARTFGGPPNSPPSRFLSRLLPTTWAVLQLSPLPASPSFTASP